MLVITTPQIKGASPLNLIVRNFRRLERIKRMTSEDWKVCSTCGKAMTSDGWGYGNWIKDEFSYRALGFETRRQAQEHAIDKGFKPLNYVEYLGACFES